ncbi:MAG: hypothetical protein L0Y58_12890, partial [Verrucomicrobia subdivision 3 bacterium]|nr:hypothetical protein [Limisphaerales bacterium]
SIIDEWEEKWDCFTMKSAKVDDRRRVVLPQECPPRSTVTIEALDEGTWIIRRQGKRVKFKRILIPAVETLPSDPKWDKIENAFAQSSYKDLLKRPAKD